MYEYNWWRIVFYFRKIMSGLHLGFCSRGGQNSCFRIPGGGGGQALHAVHYNIYRISLIRTENASVLLVSSELLAGIVFEGAFYSRARSIPFSLSVTKFFSKYKKPWTISLHNHTILIHHKQNYFIQHTNVRFIY